ncbi:MAG TPA: gamma-glutamyl-gamma-aminobutyrate hydrolase family protein [Longimicrobiaceae bacterium]|nr:gamma-glutamyl-gamma-aminobutyrate hydrolase family protein [Longimicrobiaceae bacterium]
MRPLIVVTTTLGPGGSYQLPQVQLNVQYVTAVEEPGGTALLLTPGHTPESIHRLVGLAHGLVLTGGEDVDPARYGQEPHPELGTVNRPRDEIEFAALGEALRRRMPVLAICRGCQLLNVAMGGTLYQDLPSQRPGRIHHEQTAPWNHRWHQARVEPGSRLHGIFGTGELSINSFHHQAVDRLAPGLEATVWSEDGIVEGVEARDYPWVYGVQWHPERGEAHAPGDERDPDRRLFWALVQAAREYGETVTPAAERSGVRVGTG